MSFLSSVLPLLRGRIALISQMKRGAAWSAAFVFAFAVLSACGPTSSAEHGPLNTQNGIPAMSVPPGINDRPLQPGQSGTEYMPNGLPALAPARGVNADTMFAEKLSSEDARFKRLENAVADLRREFEAVKPAIVRLSAVESDMEELVSQLQTLVPQAVGQRPMDPMMPPPPGAITINDVAPIPDIGPMSDMDTEALAETRRPPSAPKAAPAPVAAPKTATPEPKAAAPPVKIADIQPKEEKPPVAKTTGGAAASKNGADAASKNGADAAPKASGKQTVTGVRVGEHNGKTRIVIDVGAKTAFTHNLDNSEHLLMIELPKAAWAGAKSAKFPNSPLLTSWTATADGGVILAVQLKKNAEVVSASSLAATGSQPFRIIFDLKVSP